MVDIRVGQGVDYHKLETGSGFILGGIKIECNKKIISHSDGDVLSHSISDAILGAINNNDIGYHFPDNINKTKNIDSFLILKKCYQFLLDKEYKISNIDSTIILEKPKLRNYICKIKKNIASILNIDKQRVSIKATTKEKMDDIGKNNGICVHSVVLIYK